MKFSVNSACRHHYDQNALQDMMEGHPLFFLDFKRMGKVLPGYELNARMDKPCTDPWGCVRKTTDDGIT